ncbi:hypothetical protein [Paradevosia shaoguanensis]|uniref:Uncharacterized protein n=1 Tax=Paradevosia shaoguanensis TaxID=1335043 RepID=A0AA41QNA8_9HYPH|nr:hypothetical protein [Paradevosia shaoguanensis]MCF1743276.1 hypothetical protein [Paradevosia shaoguanensis]MCI0127759.1 hypothetical protein [Paradevosia shaoguanensis]
MFSTFAKLLLVLTAISPVALVYAWVLYANCNYLVAGVLVALSAVLLLLCWLLLRAANDQLERSTFKPVSVEAADRENIAFMLLYLSPLFTSDFGSLNLSVLIPSIVIFAVMSATGYNYHFNPLLGLLGWHFYRVTSPDGVTFVLITRRQLRRAGQETIVGQLTDYILIDVGNSDASKLASSIKDQ